MRWAKVLSFGMLLMIALLPALAQAQSSDACRGWTQVNDGAFGIPSNYDQYGNPVEPPPAQPFNGEEGFEVLVFQNRLYVGMEGDNLLGSRLWRTKAGVVIPSGQSDWEEVAADDNGYPFGVSDTEQNDHIDSLAEYRGYLYASNANRSGSPKGTLVYRSATGASNSWTLVNTAGFGDTKNENFKDMVVFTVASTKASTDWLCGGTGNLATGAEVWCTSGGTNWSQMNGDGFGNPKNTLVASSAVFDGKLYLGVSNQETGGEVFRTADLSSWEEVYSDTGGRARVEMVGVLDGELYIAAGAHDGRNPATEPTIQLYRSSTGDAGSWSQLNIPIDDDENNTRTIVDGATIYNNALYLATMNVTTGTEVWRTADGTNWSQVNDDGFGYATTFAAELIPFNGYLYAWSSDYTRGQAVWRTKCPICETQDIDLTGSYPFAGVGATLDFTSGNLDSVQVCVYPGAFPTAWTSNKPVMRHYEIEASGGTFVADLTLSYTDDEFASSDIGSEDSTYLTRWNGSDWVDCPADKRRDTDNNTVTCNDVSAFSTWAIAGDSGSPTAVVLRGLRASTPAGNPVVWLLAVGLLALLLGWRPRKAE